METKQVGGSFRPGGAVLWAVGMSPVSEERPMDMLEKRIDELEMRAAHQERTIGELNDLIAAQWKKTEALERQLQRYAEELQALGPADAPSNQKPPHY
jgi:SlyX protein